MLVSEMRSCFFLSQMNMKDTVLRSNAKLRLILQQTVKGTDLLEKLVYRK